MVAAVARRRPDPFVENWRTAIMASSVPSGAKVVGERLSKRGRHDGTSNYPTVATLMLATGLSRRAVQEHLRLLEAAGWIERVRGPGRGRGTEYRLVIPEDGADDPFPF